MTTSELSTMQQLCAAWGNMNNQMLEFVLDDNSNTVLYTQAGTSAALLAGRLFAKFPGNKLLLGALALINFVPQASVASYNAICENQMGGVEALNNRLSEAPGKIWRDVMSFLGSETPPANKEEL